VRIATVGLGLLVVACSGGERAEAPKGSGSGSAEPDRRALAADANDLVPPGLRLPDGVEPTRYELSLDLDPASDKFHGSVAIGLRLAAPRDHVWVHAAELELGGVEVEVAGATRAGMIAPAKGDEMVAIDLGGVAPAGELVLRIQYTGTYHDDDAVGLFRRDVDGVKYVYSQLEAVQARRVMPCLDEPRWKVPWTISVRAPKSNLAVSNAPLASMTPDGDAAVFRFAPTEALPSYLVAIGVGPFAVIELGTVGERAVPFRVIAPAGTKAGALAVVRAATAPIVAWLEAYFARPLPFAKLDYIAVPDFPGAMENAGLIAFDVDLLLLDNTPAARAGYIELAGHELAHQWFGNLVTLAWWDDLWLNESFATWMADRVAAELATGRDHATAQRGEVETAVRADADPEAAALRRTIKTNTDIEDSFDAIAYEKGAAVIAMFEAWIGRDKLQQAMRAYLEAHAGGVSDSTGFLDAIERVSDAGVRAAFATFVDQPGVPLVTLERRCDGPTARIGVTQERLVPVDSATPVTTWRVPVCVRFPTGKPAGKAGRGKGAVAEGCVLLGGTAAEIDLGTPTCPAWIIGNAGDRGYYLAQVPAASTPPMAVLAPRERLGLVGDLEALLAAGRADPAAVTAIVPQLVATGEERDERAVLSLVGATEALVTDERLPAWRRWARKLLAKTVARTRVDGGAPMASGERQLRTERLMFAAFSLGDERVIREARARAERWLAGQRGAIADDDLGLVLGAAARGADRAFADRLLAKAAQLPVGARGRVAALAAVVQTGDPDAVTAALHAVSSADERDGEELAWLIRAAARTSETRPALFDLYADAAALAGVVETLGRRASWVLIGAFDEVCDTAEKATVLAKLAPVVTAIEGGDDELAEIETEIDRCVARRTALGAKLDLELGP
jgi:alanyl aminopeptidase